MSELKFPSNKVLKEAIVLALQELDGVANTKQINDKIIEILDLPEEIVTMEDENDLSTKLNYRLRWCRTDLKASGVIRNKERGVWCLENNQEKK